MVANDDERGTRLAPTISSASGTGASPTSRHGRRVGRLRRDTFVTEMHAAGLDPVVEPCDMTEEGGYRAAVRLLRADRSPDRDLRLQRHVRVGALSVAEELGLAVPRRPSLVGYDNTHLAGIRHLWLTTVDNASFEVGRRAGRALLQRISTPDTPASEQLVDPRLQVRGSTAAPYDSGVPRNEP